MRDYVIVIDKPYMGGADQELGEILLRTFVRTSLKCSKAPKAILLYNEGVKLINDPEIGEFFDSLIAKGSKLLICGTCIDYFDMDITRGERSSMEEIMNLQVNYKVLRP